MGVRRRVLDRPRGVRRGRRVRPGLLPLQGGGGPVPAHAPPRRPRPVPADRARAARRRGGGFARRAHGRVGRPVYRQARPPPTADVAAAPRGDRLGRAAGPPAGPLILLLHNRYRVPGGEERAVADLAWLIRTELGEDAAVLQRDSERLGRERAAVGLLAGGLRPAVVVDAVRRSGARVVHAHNVHPAFGWRALAAARAAGARVVLHLHNYRLVCAIGTCFTRGEDCTRCHGRNTLPGVRLNCRGSRVESVVYGASLALWQRRLAAQADAIVVPSEFALGRLRELGAPLGDRARVVPSVQRSFAPASAAASGAFALAAGRLTPEKGFADAVAACTRAGVPLVVAGDGPQLEQLRSLGGDVRFTGR